MDLDFSQVFPVTHFFFHGFMVRRSHGRGKEENRKVARVVFFSQMAKNVSGGGGVVKTVLTLPDHLSTSDPLLELTLLS
jgi:hypothetical protein